MAQILLTYKNTTLRQADIELYSGNNWLNDTCINFYYDWLSNDLPAGVLLVDPSASFLIVFENDMEDLEPFLKGLDIGAQRYVFLPVTNNMDQTLANAGSHWTLLVLDNLTNRALSFDSMGSTASSLINAQIIADKVGTVSGRCYTFESVSGEAHQADGYNCGVFVLGYTVELLGKIRAEGELRVAGGFSPTEIRE
jgi:Ulp1 family protease